MKYIDYKEHREQGTFNFPLAYYHATPTAPRYHMQYHWHTYYEIIRVVSGNLHLTLDNKNRTLYPGECVMVSGGALHGATPHDNCVYDCIVFDFQMLAKENHTCAKIVHGIITQKYIIKPYLSDYSDDILPIITNLCEILASRKPGYEFATQGYLYLLLSVILEQRLYEEVVYDSAASNRLTSIKNVLTHISDNYANPITLDSLAKIAGMNPKYFCRYFKSVTERTPIDYLNYYRIECACEMLSTKDISIKETAISCGFNDESYFIKTFSKYKGITPKQFTRLTFQNDT